MQTQHMSANEKLAGIEKAGWPFAWDGCHKIYLLTNESQEAEARANEYDVYPVAQLRESIANSCGLVFVSLWGLSTGVWTNELTIEQGDEDLWRLLGWPLEAEED